MSLGAWWDGITSTCTRCLGLSSWDPAMPRAVMSRDLIARIQPLAVALAAAAVLPPIGFEHQISGYRNTLTWLAGCVVTPIAAVLGKGSPAARRACDWAFLPGSHGLHVDERPRSMELIMINIGLQRSYHRRPVRHAGDHGRRHRRASPIFERLAGSGNYKPEPEGLPRSP